MSTRFSHLPGVIYPQQAQSGPGRFAHIPGVIYPQPSDMSAEVISPKIDRQRGRVLNAEETARAVRLYRDDGVWLAPLSRMFRISADSMRRILKENGVTMRHSHYAK